MENFLAKPPVPPVLLDAEQDAKAWTTNALNMSALQPGDCKALATGMECVVRESRSPDRLWLLADCLSTRMALPMIRMLSAVSFEMYGGNASRITCRDPTFDTKQEPDCWQSHDEQDALISSQIIRAGAAPHKMPAKRLIPAKSRRIIITLQSLLHLLPLARKSESVKDTIPYLETLLPLKSTSIVILGGSPANVLFWQRCLYEEVLSSTQQHPMHHPAQRR